MGSYVTEHGSYPLSGVERNITAMGNGILNLPLIGNLLIPYCGFGAGSGWSLGDSFCDSFMEKDERGDHLVHISGMDEVQRYTCCQVITGIGCSFGRIRPSLEYRYISTFTYFDCGTHTFDLGMNYNF